MFYINGGIIHAFVESEFFHSIISFSKSVHDVCLQFNMTLNTYINFCFFLKLHTNFNKAFHSEDKGHVELGDSKESKPSKQNSEQMNEW